MKDRLPDEAERSVAGRPRGEASPRRGTRLNGKVIAGLAVLALGLLVVAPRLVPRVAPLLLVAACPLSMAVMMWGMRGNQGHSDQCAPPSEPAAARTGDSAEEELAALRSQLARMTAEQELLRTQMGELQAGRPGGGHEQARAEASGCAGPPGDAARR